MPECADRAHGSGLLSSARVVKAEGSALLDEAQELPLPQRDAQHAAVQLKLRLGCTCGHQIPSGARARARMLTDLVRVGLSFGAELATAVSSS